MLPAARVVRNGGDYAARQPIVATDDWTAVEAFLSSNDRQLPVTTAAPGRFAIA